MVVVGGGTGGLTAALIAASTGARVALIERERTGGDCLWTGCVPSKGLVEAATLAHRMRHADSLGLRAVDPEIDVFAVMDHVRGLREALAPHDSPERLRRAGIDVILAHARFAAPGRIAADGRDLRYRTAVIATGSRPTVPDIPGFDTGQALTTDTVWELSESPQRLVILGGGPTGCELGQAFARLGASVTIVESAERLLGGEEPRASDLVATTLRAEGIDVRLQAVGSSVGAARLEVRSPDGPSTIGFDRLLVAIGRRPYTEGLGLETVGAHTDERGALIVDPSLQTTARNVYAVGDVTGMPAFTHVAAHQARAAVFNALFRTRRPFDDRAIPRVTFTDPEIASVGLTEQQAQERYGAFLHVTEFDYEHLDRAILAGRPDGFAKLIGNPTGRLVGATVAAPAGGEAIAELVAAVAAGAPVSRISRTVHAYPTLAEGPSRAADDYVRARFAASRTRRYTRPILAALRVLDRPR